MKVSSWVHYHPRSILFLLASLAVAGAVSIWSLPVGLFPRVTFPRVVVSVDAGDRPAERMVTEVTRVVEEAVRAVPQVRNVRSISSRGSAEISINFAWGADMIAAQLQIESAINQVRASLPAGTTTLVRRMDTTVFPVLGYSLTSDTVSPIKLRDIALYQLRPLLSTVPGVANVGVLGGGTEERQVIVDPDKLDSYHLTIEDVSRALSGANVLTAVGRLEQDNKLYLLLSDTRFHNVDEIRNTVVGTGPNGFILVEDIGSVSRATEPQWIRVTADGHDAVLFQVYQQPGGNTVQIADRVRRELARFKSKLPAGVKIANWYDQSDLIVASADSVRDAVLVGVVLSALVLLLFLGNARITLIASITVPVVLATTTLLLSLLDMSFNIMTLGGMAAAVGLIIDDAIVMVEHIVRRLSDGHGLVKQRVSAAAAELTRPLAGSSASTIIIFAPLAFLTGVTGAFFKALSLTMAASLVISFVVAWLAVPLLALSLLRESDTAHSETGAVTRWFRARYEGLMTRVLRRPWTVLVAIAPLLVAGWVAYHRVGTGFIPSMDEGGFILDYRAPAGTSLTETDRMLRQVEDILATTPEVETYSRRTGLQLGGGLTEANEGDYFIRLKPFPRRGIDEVMDGVRRRVEAKLPTLHIEMALLMEDLIGDLTAVPQPIEIKLFSDDGKLLRKLGPKVAAAIGKVPGVVDVSDGIVLAGDAVTIRINRDKAALEGVAPEQVTSLVNAAMTGVVSTNVLRGPKLVNIRVWIPPAQRARTRNLRALRLRAPDGHLFPLSRIATVTPVTGQPQIMRDDLKRMIAVTARISGRDLGSTIRDVKAVLARPGLLPPEVYYRLGGLYEQQRIAFRGLVRVFSAAVVLVFVLLLFLYESFRVAIAMLANTMLAVGVVFVGLWITRTELNVTAMMGMTMVVGIVTETAIFYVSEYAGLDPTKDGHDRLIAAGSYRMRPIAMTTLAAILALSPLALGIGQGAAMQTPLAIAIISGLVVQVPLVLIVLPALLVLVRHDKHRPGGVGGLGRVDQGR